MAHYNSEKEYNKICMKEITEALKEEQKFIKIGEVLDIPVQTSNSARRAFLYMDQFLEIISDEEKVKEIRSKLKNKAFW